MSDTRTNWQPIETAPKDGPLLMWWPDICGVQIGTWRAETADPFWESAIGLGKRWHRAHSPTHWMPLPDPPAEVQS